MSLSRPAIFQSNSWISKRSSSPFTQRLLFSAPFPLILCFFLFEGKAEITTGFSNPSRKESSPGCALWVAEASVLVTLDLDLCTRVYQEESHQVKPLFNSAHSYCPYVSVTAIHMSGNVKKKKNPLEMFVDFSSESHEREQ